MYQTWIIEKQRKIKTQKACKKYRTSTDYAEQLEKWIHYILICQHLASHRCLHHFSPLSVCVIVPLATSVLCKVLGEINSIQIKQKAYNPTLETF